MPKGKLVITNADDLKRLPAAAELAGVSLTGEPVKVGKEVHTEIIFKEPASLYRMGQYSRDISEADVKAFEERKAAKIARSQKAKEATGKGK